MTIKQVLSFALVALLSIQNTFSMELENSTSGEKSKTPQSKVKKSGRPSKRHKCSSDKEKEAEEESAQVIEDEQDQEALSFDVLPIELRYGICFFLLQCIIQNNTVFTPLDGVKEFFNTLSLVNKKWHDIAVDLGWNYKLSGENTEPRYKMMVKAFWVPTEILEKNSTLLNSEMLCILVQIKLKSDSRALSFNFRSDNKSDRQKKLCRRVAQYLIAGADANIKINNCPLLIYVINCAELHNLIPLLLLKQVNINCYDACNSTPLIAAAWNPEIVKQLLLTSNYEEIDHRDDSEETALMRAVIEDTDKCIESVELLLKHKACANDALYMILTRPLELDHTIPEDYQFSDVDIKMAKLSIAYGAKIADLEGRHLIKPLAIEKLLKAIE